MKKTKQSLLWQITDIETQKVGYLFGTMHIWDTQAIDLSESLVPFLEKSTLFAAESELDKLQNFQESLMYLPDNQTLTTIFGEKKANKIALMLKKIMGVPMSQVERLQPMMLTSMLSGALMVKGEKMQLDLMIWQIATDLGLETTGIETAAEQAAIFRKIPLAYQQKQLLDLVKNVKKYTQQFKKLAHFYAEGDLHSLYIQSKKGLKDMRKMMLYDRNKLMATRIAALIPSQSCFIAIGAGHLAGKKGVLRLLADKNFEIEPLVLK